MIIKLENCTVLYGKKRVLENINLVVKRKEFLGIIGPNGAGKTTLLKIINGLKKVSSGNVWVFGKLLTAKTEREIRMKTGYVPQNVFIDPRSPVTVEEVVMMGRYGKIGLFRNEDKRDKIVVKEVMKLCGIEFLKNRPAGQLSGGEKQKMLIARCLAQEPELILLDEPTSNLDPQARKEIIKIIEKIHTEKNSTIIFVTHLLSHIPKQCKKLILLYKGKILKEGEKREILRKKVIYSIYGAI